jgi:hypothetical protein
MARKRHLLTAAVEASICAYIRAGGFPHVAAEAAGVPRQVFERWLRQGQEGRGGPKYRHFYEAVQQAQAQARLGAEVAALNDKPMDWLKSGPGKETTTGAGWTSAVRPRAGDSAEVNPFLQAEIQALVHLLLEALAPFPEARAAAARALGQPETPSGKRHPR